MGVELQWKRSAGSRRYNLWFAIVRKVVSAEAVELFFPQYGATAEGAGALTGVSLIYRTQETPMHGGLAGGIRLASRAELQQWWDVLLTDRFDLRPQGDDRWLQDEDLESWSQTKRQTPAPDLQMTTIRERFREHAPADAAETSLRLAPE